MRGCDLWIPVPLLLLFRFCDSHIGNQLCDCSLHKSRALKRLWKPSVNRSFAQKLSTCIMQTRGSFIRLINDTDRKESCWCQFYCLIKMSMVDAFVDTRMLSSPEILHNICVLTLMCPMTKSIAQLVYSYFVNSISKVPKSL